MTTPLEPDRVELRGSPLVRATQSEVTDLETRLEATFPAGYREYVTQLGEGVLSDLVRVLPPWRVLGELEAHRGTMAGFWFWESGDDAFDQAAAMESIPLADTLDGDVIAFHPTAPERIVVLPRHHDRVYVRGPDFLETINWVCSGRVIRSLGPERYFEPFDSRVEQPRENESGRSAESKEYATHPPRLTGPPLDVLLACLDELRAVEEWAIERSGGPSAFSQDDPPEMNDQDMFELIGRTNEVHRRYCSPALASALSGASVSVASPPEHDQSSIRVLEEKVGPIGQVTIRVAIGTEFGEILDYVLEESAGDWRITSQRVRGYLDA